MKWSTICTSIKSGGLGVKKKIGFNLIKLFWKSGFDDMLRRGKLCGDQWWNLSMGV
jgi:hypothetical protein